MSKTPNEHKGGQDEVYLRKACLHVGLITFNLKNEFCSYTWCPKKIIFGTHCMVVLINHFLNWLLH